MNDTKPLRSCLAVTPVRNGYIVNEGRIDRTRSPQDTWVFTDAASMADFMVSHYVKPRKDDEHE